MFWDWWNGSYFGRVTLMDFFGLPAGVVVLLVVLMALFMFWGGEKLEAIFGKKDLSKEPRWRYAAAGILVAGAALVLLLGQPDSADKWARIELTKDAALAAREVQISPAELLNSREDNQINLVMLDVRDEADFNLFHLRNARHLPLASLSAAIPELAPRAGRQHGVRADEQRRSRGHRGLEAALGGKRAERVYSRRGD